MTSSSKNGSKVTARWRRAAPTMPSSSSRAATRSTTACVSATVRAIRTPVLALELAEEQRHDDRGRAGRGADLQLAGELALALAGDLVEDLPSSVSSRCAPR